MPLNSPFQFGDRVRYQWAPGFRYGLSQTGTVTYLKNTYLSSKEIGILWDGEEMPRIAQWELLKLVQNGLDVMLDLLP